MLLLELRLSYYDLILLNTGIGFALGLIPLILSFFKKKIKLGLLGVVSSTIGGALLGIFLAIPVTIVFVWLVLRKALPEGDGADLPENSENK